MSQTPWLGFETKDGDGRHAGEHSRTRAFYPPLLRLRLEPRRRADAPPVPERAPRRAGHIGRLPPRLRRLQQVLGRRRGDGRPRRRSPSARARVGHHGPGPRATRSLRRPPRRLRPAPPLGGARTGCAPTGSRLHQGSRRADDPDRGPTSASSGAPTANTASTSAASPSPSSSRDEPRGVFEIARIPATLDVGQLYVALEGRSRRRKEPLGFGLRRALLEVPSSPVVQSNRAVAWAWPTAQVRPSSGRRPRRPAGSIPLSPVAHGACGLAHQARPVSMWVSSSPPGQGLPGSCDPVRVGEDQDVAGQRTSPSEVVPGRGPGVST